MVMNILQAALTHYHQLLHKEKMVEKLGTKWQSQQSQKIFSS